MGRAYLGSADYARALEAFERARNLQTPETDREERAETAFGLARALWEGGASEHGRALALAAAGRSDAEAGKHERRVARHPLLSVSAPRSGFLHHFGQISIPHLPSVQT